MQPAPRDWLGMCRQVGAFTFTGCHGYICHHIYRSCFLFSFGSAGRVTPFSSSLSIQKENVTCFKISITDIKRLRKPWMLSIQAKCYFCYNGWSLWYYILPKDWGLLKCPFWMTWQCYQVVVKLILKMLCSPFMFFEQYEACPPNM